MKSYKIKFALSALFARRQQVRGAVTNRAGPSKLRGGSCARDKIDVENASFDTFTPRVMFVSTFLETSRRFPKKVDLRRDVLWLRNGKRETPERPRSQAGAGAPLTAALRVVSKSGFRAVDAHQRTDPGRFDRIFVAACRRIRARPSIASVSKRGRTTVTVRLRTENRVTDVWSVSEPCRLCGIVLCYPRRR